MFQLSPTDLAKIQKILFMLAKNYYKKLYSAGSNSNLQFYRSPHEPEMIYCKFLCYDSRSGAGVSFMFSNNGSLLNKNNWRFFTYVDANFEAGDRLLQMILSPYSGFTRVL